MFMPILRKKVSNRSMLCPFCNEKIKVQESTEMQMNRQFPKVRMISIVASAVLTIVVFLIWRLVMYGLLAMFGESLQTGFMAASGLHIFKSILLVTISAILFLVVPLIAKVNSTVLHIILTVVCCLLHFAVILPGTIPTYIESPRAEINMMATVISRVLIFVYGLAVPLFQGTLSLMGGCCDLKKIMIRQGISAGTFEILSALFVWGGIRFSSNVVIVLGPSAAVAAILVFIAVLLMTTRKNRAI